MIDLEDELGYLEGLADNLKMTRKQYIDATNYLEVFERKIRKHGYKEIVSQSNAQKMQLAFEHSVALDENNWKVWEGLMDRKAEAEKNLEDAKIDWELALQRVKLIEAVNDNVE